MMPWMLDLTRSAQSAHVRKPLLWALGCVLLAALPPVASRALEHHQTQSGPSAVPPEAVWLEGEAFTSSNITKPNVSGWGHAEYLSGDKWLQVSVDADKVEKEFPVQGGMLAYTFAAPANGNYEVWNRIGYEFVRSPFEWRIDGGAWQAVSPQELTTDLMELQTWNEVAWLKMGQAALSAGSHKLEIHLPRTQDKNGKWERVLYASDALCLTRGLFHPNGKFPPGAAWQTDQDKAAAAHAFQIPASSTPAQTSFSLKGLWQIARYDEGFVEDRAGPIHDLPDDSGLYWKSIAVPGDRNQLRPEWNMNHRYFYRTRVHIPAQAADRSFYLHFPALNMIAGVWVNGQNCGWMKTPLAVWDCDITRAVKPGQDNDIRVGIKDTYYALTPENDGSASGKNIRYMFNVPPDFFNDNQGITMRFDFPVWNHMHTGILQEPTLVSAGKAYVSDVFAIPSVKNKTLGLEITVHNPTDQAITVKMENDVRPARRGSRGEAKAANTSGSENKVEKAFAAKEIVVERGRDAVVKLSETWANPRLWWPDDPQQYDLNTRLSVDGKPIDARVTKFGFREWDWHAAHFSLNGMPWYGRADLYDFDGGGDPIKAVAAWRRHGQTMQRLWGNELEWGGMEREAALDFFDAQGVPIRRTDIFDGEAAKYGLTEEVTINGKTVRQARKDLFANYRAQIAAWAKGQRNHPCIFIWSMENEITFINANVFGLNEYTDPEMKRAAEILAALDPTRPQMADGGNALLDQSLPVYGGHYLESPYSFYPEEAYTLARMRNVGKPGDFQRWPIAQDKPIFLGESFFATGGAPPTYAALGGERAFVGKAETYPIIGLFARMLSEGYRWSGLAAFHLWFGGETDLHYIAWQPTAVLCRQWDWSFGSGQQVTRTVGIFNDTRLTDPITFAWTLSVGGKKIAAQTKEVTVAPGMNQKFDVSLPLPTVASRQEGTWTLALSRKGTEVFRDVKPFSVLPPARWRGTGVSFGLPPSPGRPAKVGSVPPSSHSARFHRSSFVMRPTRADKKTAFDRSPDIKKGKSGAGAQAGNVAAAGLYVYDPQSGASAFLKASGVPFTVVKNLDALPNGARTLLIGKDALSATESASSRLAAYAAEGHVVLILEQQNPLKYQGLPAAMESETNQGRVAFIEDQEHPAFRGLEQKDFFVWGADEVVYQNAYAKPSQSGKSLVQCGVELRDSALVEMPAGKGLLLLSQLQIEGKLPSSAPARQLLLNLLDYAIGYKQAFRAVACEVKENPPLAKALDASGLNYTKAESVLDAIGKTGSRIAVLAATPANLKTLADNLGKAQAFTRSGGWIVLNGLTPEGLADYNKLVGVEHIIRPFRRERVTFPPVRSPLTAGLATSNIVMTSGQRLFGYRDDEYVASDGFSYVVDYEDVAPFARSTFFAFDNIVNNFVSADGWPLIIDFPAPTDGKPFPIPLTLPRPETITEFTWIGNTFYAPTTKVNLVFDGEDRLAFDTKPNDQPQTFAVSPGKAGREITLELAEWKFLPDKQSNGKDLIGIDNIYLKAKRSPDFYKKVKPLLNIGAMMAYPQGLGGIVLCNVKYQETESVPANAAKKQAILATLLRNLQAPFSGGKTLIAGANLKYQAIDLKAQANAYRGEQGWFGDKNFTFKDLPTGRQAFGGVTYNVYDFPTSPVPTVIVLNGPGVPGNLREEVKDIAVNQKADALFFLYAARIDNPLNDQERREKKRYEMLRYVVHYADGQSVDVPIYQDVDIADFKQKTPLAIPGAQIAWTRPYPGTEYSAVAYSKQWNNPRPNVEIRSVDMVYGKDRRGVPALLALTAATAQ